jgi:hypothetical protein
MTDKAQLALLSKLDSTGRIDGCVFVFTCNSTDRLESRYSSHAVSRSTSQATGWRGTLPRISNGSGTRRAGMETGQTSRVSPKIATITFATALDGSK